MTQKTTATLRNIDGKPFNWEEARHDIARVLGQHSKKRHPRNQAITPRIQAMLDETIPNSCLAMGEENAYIPALLLKEIAYFIFKDRWSTSISDTKPLAQGRISLNFQNGNADSTKTHLVMQTTLKLTVHSADGKEQQSHEALGLCGYDQNFNDPHYMKMYRIAVKGAETNALNSALSRFGRIFTTAENSDYETNQDTVLPPPKRITAKKAPEPTPVIRKEVPPTPSEGLTLHDGDNTTEYSNDQEGAYDWLESYTTSIATAGSLNHLSTLCEENLRTLTAIKSQYGKSLADLLTRIDHETQRQLAHHMGIQNTAKPTRKKRKKTDSTETETPKAKNAEKDIEDHDTLPF